MCIRTTPVTRSGVLYLRAGGDVFTLQESGAWHSLEMVCRYLESARTDIAIAHRRVPPLDR